MCDTENLGKPIPVVFKTKGLRRDLEGGAVFSYSSNPGVLKVIFDGDGNANKLNGLMTAERLERNARVHRVFAKIGTQYGDYGARSNMLPDGGLPGNIVD